MKQEETEQKTSDSASLNELLKILEQSEEDVRNGRVAPFSKTIQSLGKELQKNLSLW